MKYCVVSCKHEEEDFRIFGFRMERGDEKRQRQTFEKWCESFGYEIIDFNIYSIDSEVYIDTTFPFISSIREETQL